MTAYYTATGNPAVRSRGTSALERAEFTLIQTAFSSVQTDLALKGAKAGETWTGTHDYTAATLTAATQTVGDSSTKVATTAFVQAQAFSTILPSQAGNAGKGLTTDGSTASWTTFGVGAGGTGNTSYTIGDILYASGTATLSKLAGVATGNALISGGVGTAPAWGKVGLTTHVTGTLGAANGGTGVANNAASTITISGAFGVTMTLTNTTSVTFPTTGTLATLTGTETLSNKTLTAPNIGAATGTSLVVTGALTSSGTAGIGYATGAGGSVTQATSKSTAVTLNKICGRVTTNNASLAGGAVVSFVVNNSLVAITDTVLLTYTGAGITANAYDLSPQVNSGSFYVTVKNVTAGALAEAIDIQYVVVKSTPL